MIALLKRELQAAAEGTTNSDVETIVAVLPIEDKHIMGGTIDPMTGYAVFEVKYDAVVFKPFINEALDSIVSSTNTVSDLIRCVRET